MRRESQGKLLVQGMWVWKEKLKETRQVFQVDCPCSFYGYGVTEGRERVVKICIIGSLTVKRFMRILRLRKRDKNTILNWRWVSLKQWCLISTRIEPENGGNTRTRKKFRNLRKKKSRNLSKTMWKRRILKYRNLSFPITA